MAYCSDARVSSMNPENRTMSYDIECPEVAVFCSVFIAGEEATISMAFPAQLAKGC